jgi:methionyl-tRNA formyltransferase
MKAIFAGTPEFADVALRALLAARIEVPLVLTQPDRPAGRGMKLQASPVKQTALAHGITVAQPRSLRLDGKYPEDAAAARDAILAAQADVMVVAAYGLILPQWVLDAMSGDGPSLAAKAPSGGSAPCEAGSVGAKKLGCLNIHGSLLPRWRGAAPIHRAIEAGDTETGITIMQMDAGLDTGDMLLVEKLPIAPTDTTATLHDKLAPLGGRLIVEALELAACGGFQPVKQPEAGVTYAHKIDKAESRIDWSQPAAVIERKIRALDPFPGCTTTVTTPQGEETLKIWRSQIHSWSRASHMGPGHVLPLNSGELGVQTGEGCLLLTELQRAGGKRMTTAEVLRGWPIEPGQRLG